MVMLLGNIAKLLGNNTNILGNITNLLGNNSRTYWVGVGGVISEVEG
jgi:hypothetical protein